MHTTYAKIMHDNLNWIYLTPLGKNEETKTQILDTIKEGEYYGLHEETLQLTSGEVAKHLIDSPITQYVHINNDRAQKLIDHKNNATINYGEEAYLNDEYHDVILDMFKSGKLFTIVPKNEVLQYLLETSN